MKKRIQMIGLSVFLCAAVALSGCSSSGITIKHTALEGTAGANSSEEAENLFDNDATTKWCVTKFSEAYCIWETDEAIAVTGYIIVTANDNTKYAGRNPASWVLSGCCSDEMPQRDSEDWQVIDNVQNSDVLQDVNYTDYSFSVAGTSEAYNYYMLEITETQGAAVMQMSEFALSCKGSSYSFTGGTETDGGSDSSDDNDGTIPKTQHMCFVCGGDGKCTNCDGYGYVYSSASKKRDRICNKCYTTGKCYYCGGLGYYY